MEKKKTLKIDLDELFSAIEDSSYEHEYYLDLATGSSTTGSSVSGSSMVGCSCCSCSAGDCSSAGEPPQEIANRASPSTSPPTQYRPHSALGYRPPAPEAKLSLTLT